MKKLCLPLASAALLFTCSFGQSVCAGQSGESETRFNRKFIPNIKPKMTYEQLVKVIGVQGVKVVEDRKKVPTTIHYRWNGGKNSVLTVRMSNNQLIDATILAPNQQTYFIKNNGTVVEQ